MKKTATIALSSVLFAISLGSLNSQTRDVKIDQGKCNIAIVNAGSGDQKVQIESGICADPSDPSKAMRVKYVWLDSASVSLLFAGKVDGELAQSLGGRPYVLRNRVYDEVSQVIDKFGSNLGEQGLTGTTVFTDIEGKKIEGQYNSFGTQRDFSTFRKKVGKAKIYNAEELVTLPDVEAYQAIQNSNVFPANYSMYYRGDIKPSDILDVTVLWRPITSSDLQNYTQNLARFRDLVLRKTLKVSTHDSANAKGTVANLKSDFASNRVIAAMRYFSREGLPEDFLFAVADPTGCGTDRDYPSIFLEPRRFYVQVAVIENVQGRGVVRISSVMAEQIDTNQLRASEPDVSWKPIELSFPAGALQSNESLVIPLHIELRPGDLGVQDSGLTQDPGSETLKAISKYAKPIVAQNEKGRILYRKTREAFKAPTLPTTRTYTYGPHLRLVAAVTEGKQIALRQYDPSKASMRFGFLEGSCPGIYVQPVDEPSLISYGRILRGATGKNRSRTDVFSHDGPAKFIELIEDEPEITRLTSLKIFVIDADGNEKLVSSTDSEFIIPGSPLRIESPELVHASKIRIEVQGYYKSLPRMLLEHVTLKDM